MPIPAFTDDGVLPHHEGDPNNVETASPFLATTLELCQRFADTHARREVLKGFLQLRALLHQLRVVQGFQWVDGTFLEDEKRNKKTPVHLQVVTFCEYSSLLENPQFLHVSAPLQTAKATREAFRVEHKVVPLDWPKKDLINHSRFHYGRMSHQQETGIYKGLLEIKLNTTQDDGAALQHLKKLERA